MKIDETSDTKRTTSASISVNIGDYSITPNKINRYYLLPPASVVTSSSADSNDVISVDHEYQISPTPSHADEESDENFVHLVHVSAGDDSSSRKPFSEIMTPVGYTETVAVGGVDARLPRRSCASFCHYETDQRDKVELVLGKHRKLQPVAYRESTTCYGHSSTRRRYRSTVEYRPRLVAESFSDTCYVRPKRPMTTFVSYLDVGSDERFLRRKWFSSAVRVEPLTISNVVVGGFEWMSASQRNAEVVERLRYSTNSMADESVTSSGICSEDEDEVDNWTRGERHRVTQFDDDSHQSTTLVVRRH